MKPSKLSKDQIQNTLTDAVDAAIDFIESEVAPSRIKAQKYFNGKSAVEYEEGRSKVVATKCRDAVRAVKPALMRVFLQSGKPVEFIPSNPATAAGAEQATNYAQWTFSRNSGFSILSDVFHDALLKKVGIVKVWYDKTDHVEIDEYTGIDENVLAFIKADPEIEVLEEEIETEAQFQDGMAMVPPALHRLRVARTSKRGRIKIKAVAPEDFFVDAEASGIDDCHVCGHVTRGRVGDLVAMGFDFSEVYELSGDDETTTQTEENVARTGFQSDGDDESDDPSMRVVRITEAYMRMDIEGTGVPRLYKFICAGGKHKVLDYELCDYVPFAVFEVDPEPHTFFGRSLVEIIQDDQDASTSMLRGLLDSIHIANNPRLIVNDALVSVNDVMNNEIGGIIRAKDINAVRELTFGQGAGVALPAMQYVDEMTRSKSGITGAGMGMDADALQSQTAAGVNAAVQAASAVGELIARTLAEGGMVQLFRLIAQIARANPNPDEMIRIDGQFVQMDPRSWAADMDMNVNVGLGTNQHSERVMMLNQMFQTQSQIWQSFGPQNGLVSLTGMRNTLADMMALAGIHNADRYLNPMNAQAEQQLMAQQAQAAQAAQGQGGSDPNAAYLQAEQMKVSARVQADQQKAQLDYQKTLMQDDRERDKMNQDLALGAAKILGQYGATVDVARVKAENAMTNPFGGAGNVGQ